VPLRTLPTPLSKLAKLVFSYHEQIAKLEDFSPFSSSVFFITKLERLKIAHRRGKREEGR
jgi:hypothetical protein